MPNFASRPFSTIRVLAVDDEPMILELIERFLAADEMTITKALNGLEALRLFDREGCDLVICDRAMPDFSGEQLSRAIKERSPETPIILITGLFSATIDATPFSGFVPKPFTRDQLRSAVAALLPEDARQLLR